MTFGNKIKELRKSQNLTLQQLAMRSGLSTVTISAIENGFHAPGALTVAKLAEALHTNFKELWNIAYK